MPRLPAGIKRCIAAALAATALAAGAAPGADGQLKTLRVARTYGWQPLAADRLVFWLGVEEPYVIDLANGCTDLERDGVTGLTSHRRRLEVRVDAVVTARGRCAIQALRRADPRQLDAAGLRQADARPLPLLPAAVPRKGR